MADNDTNLSIAALEHLTGPMRGEVSWVTGSAVDARLQPENKLILAPAGPNGPAPETIARFRQVGNSYEIEVIEGRQVWINGRRTQISKLQYGDVIEFGETGPLSRFRIYDDAHRPGITVGEILGDVVSYVKTSRKPMHRKLGFASAELFRRLARETSPYFVQRFWWRSLYWPWWPINNTAPTRACVPRSNAEICRSIPSPRH
jgi:serine protease Do